MDSYTLYQRHSIFWVHKNHKRNCSKYIFFGPFHRASDSLSLGWGSDHYIYEHSKWFWGICIWIWFRTINYSIDSVTVNDHKILNIFHRRSLSLKWQISTLHFFWEWRRSIESYKEHHSQTCKEAKTEKQHAHFSWTCQNAKFAEQQIDQSQKRERHLQEETEHWLTGAKCSPKPLRVQLRWLVNQWRPVEWKPLQLQEQVECTDVLKILGVLGKSALWYRNGEGPQHSLKRGTKLHGDFSPN